MLRSQSDSLTLAVMFLSPHVVSQSWIDVWVDPGESWIQCIICGGVVDTYAGGRKSESLSPWFFQSWSKDVRLEH